jgi:hypothetical protein
VHDVEDDIHEEAQQEDRGVNRRPLRDGWLRGICLPHTKEDNAGDRAENHRRVSATVHRCEFAARVSGLASGPMALP